MTGHRSRSIIARAVVFLLLGAIVNVAVVWGLAMFAPMRYQISHSGVFGPTNIPNWDVAVVSRAGAVLIDAEASDTMARPGPPDRQKIPYWSLASLAPSEADARRERSIQEIAYGWPLIALFSRTGWNTPSEWGLSIPWFSSWDKRTLPCKLLWPGFAINSIFYAAVLWPLCTVVGKLRRRRRIKRGLCPACAYPVGTSPVCTECGEPVNSLPLEREGKGGGESCDGVQMSGRAIDPPPNPLPAREGEP